jgi:hypothetical protein
MNSTAQTPTVSKHSKNLSYATTLTNWLENSPDSQEHLEQLEQLASGSRNKETWWMFVFLLDNLLDPMPENLPPEEMFGHLESQFSETHSESERIGPER